MDRVIGDALDHLAGTWSEADLREFEAAVRVTTRVDDALRSSGERQMRTRRRQGRGSTPPRTRRGSAVRHQPGYRRDPVVDHHVAARATPARYSLRRALSSDT